MRHHVSILNTFKAFQLPRFFENLRIEIDLHREDKFVIVEMAQEVSEARGGVRTLFLMAVAQCGGEFLDFESLDL